MVPGIIASARNIGQAPQGYEQTVKDTPGLVAYWRLGSDSADAQGNVPAGTATDVTFGVAGLPQDPGDAAAGFNGSSSYIHVADDADLHLAEGTLVAWCRPTALQDGAIVSKDRAGLNAGDFTLRIDANGALLAWIQDGAAQHAAKSADGAVTAGGAICVAVLWGAGGLKLYKGGALVAENAYAGGIDANTNPLFIGAGGYGGDPSAPTHFFPGTIDEVQVYNRRLDQGEIDALAQTSYDTKVLAMSPEIYLKGDTSQDGLSLLDSSGNGRHFTLSSAIVGNPDTGAPLDGSAHGELSHNDALDRQPDVAVALRFTVNSLASRVYLGGKANASGVASHGIGTFVEPDGTLVAFADTSLGSFQLKTLPGAVSVGTEHHLILSVTRTSGFDSDDGGLQAWLDGAALEDGVPNYLCLNQLDIGDPRPAFNGGRAGNFTYSGIQRNAQPWRLGAMYGSANADIRIGKVAVFYRRLAEAERNALAGVGATPAPLPHPIWGLATTTLTGSPSAAQIQSAIDSLSSGGGGTVHLDVNGTISLGVNDKLFMKSNVRLKGNGRDSTVIDWGNSTLTALVAISFPSETSLTMTADMTTGSRTCQVSSLNGIAPGDTLHVKTFGVWAEQWERSTGGQLDPYDRAMLFPVLAASGNTITVGTSGDDRGAVVDLLTADVDVVRYWTPHRNIAIEGLELRRDPTANGGNNEFHRIVLLERVNGIRVRNLRTRNSDYVGVGLNQCIDYQIIDVDSYDSTNYVGEPNDGLNYAVTMSNGCVLGYVRRVVGHDHRHTVSQGGGGALWAIDRWCVVEDCRAWNSTPPNTNSVRTTAAWDSHSGFGFVFRRCEADTGSEANGQNNIFEHCVADWDQYHTKADGWDVEEAFILALFRGGRHLTHRDFECKKGGRWMFSNEWIERSYFEDCVMVDKTGANTGNFASVRDCVFVNCDPAP